MIRQTLIYNIVQKLHEEGALRVNNHMNYIDQANSIYNIIERVLDNVVLLEGSVIE